ncbi:MAG: hypothetical protein EBS32_05205, partial [Actinobacteria bacterium]|nr:hypothetical protein [Actinomycetota bacterium]
MVVVGVLLLVFAALLMSVFGPSSARAGTLAGEQDTTFTASTTAANTVAVLSDGNVLVGLSSNVVKYTSTGTSTGVTATYTGAVGTIRVIAGDKYYVGGGWSSKRVLRYNSNGTEDTAFVSTTAPGRVYYQDGIAVASDGSVYVAGGTNPYLYKFSSTGTQDTSFNTNVVAAPVGGAAYSVALQSDGKVLVGTSGGLVKRYNTNGTLDATLVSSTIGAVTSIVQLSDGSIVVASATSPYLRKYSSSGTLDSSFTTNVGSALNSVAQVVKVDGTGRLVVGGNFTGYVKRFSATGVVDTSFSTAQTSITGMVNSLAIQTDGNILVAYTGGVKRLLGANVAPAAPPAPTTVAGDGQATVTVSASAGATPTYYTVTAVEDATKTCTVTGSTGSCTVTGLTNGTSYTFQTTATNIDATSGASPASSAVTPIGVPPVFQSAAVNAAGTTLTLTYNESLGSTTAAASAFTVTADGSPVTVSSVSVSGSTVQLALGSPVGSGKTVTVAYAAPSSSSATSNAAVQDTVGNDAVSLSSTSVTNSSTVDQVAPVFQSATLNSAGTGLTLTYNETLSSTTAATTDFTVLVDGVAATVSSRSVSGSTVVLTLSSAVSGSSTVTVAYSAPTPNSAASNAAVQDSAGNDAASLAATAVTNSSTVGPPTLRSAVLSSSGSVLTMTFSETLLGLNNSTIQSLFTVYSDGSPVTVSGSSCCGSGSTYTINLSSVVTSNRTVTVSYAAPASDASTTNNAVQDASGADLLSITNFAVTNGSTVVGDTTAPTFSSAAVNSLGTSLTLTYNETLGSTTAGASSFTVLVDGNPVTVSSTSVSGTGVVLTLSSAVSAGQTVTVAYAAPSSSSGTSNAAVQDAAGNDAASLTTTSVTNSSTAGPDIAPPTLSTVALNGTGSQVTLTFNETLGSTAPSANAFTVFSGNNVATVTGVSVSGNTVILTLSPVVSTTAELTVAYNAPTTNTSTSNAAVQDVRGNDAASFSGSNQPTNDSWAWTGPSTGTTAGCTGTNYANRSKSKDLPNGVTYTVGVTGDYFCIGEQTEALSQRGGAAGDFTSTGLVTEPGVYLQTSNSGCLADAMCMNRGTLTISFSKPVSNPVVSFAGWGGGSGSSVAWSEMELLTPGVTVTALSGTNMHVINSGTYVEPTVKNPSTGCHSTSGFGATAQAGCGSLQVNGTVTSVSFQINLGTVRGTGYVDGWNLTASIPEDFGLVPVSYDVPAASHAVGDLKLGAVVTADQPSTLYATTNGDAVAAGAVIPPTDDGVATWPTLSAADAGSPYSIAVSLAGVTSTAHLCAWIDFNNDDVFTPGERACATDPASGDTSATITWTIPTDVTAGPTYARVRLSYDDLPLPTGKVSSGEVEDYSVTIQSASIPAAVNDTSTGAKGATQVLSPLTNDQVESGYPAVASSLKLCGAGVGPFVCNKTTLTVPGEGTYTVNTDGTVTFVPEPDFTGTATEVSYEMADTQGRTSSALITPTVRP